MNAPTVRHTTLHWTHDLAFTAVDSKGHEITVDGDSATGISPVTALLVAAGACAGADVVAILVKKRATVRSLRIEVFGTRSDEYPRRFLDMTLRFIVAGEGVTEVNAKRAVELSVEKYCSVLATLDPAMPVKTEIVVGR